MDEDQVGRNVAAQRELYGAPLGEVFRAAVETFGISQARLAEVLGLSAPMLSQLGSGRRVKIGNPAVLQRLDELNALADVVRAGRLSAAQAAGDLDRIRETVTGVLTRTDPAGADAQAAALVRDLLRSVASGEDLRDAAALLEPGYPALADVLRRYGLGRLEDAAAHLAARRPLF